MTARNIYFLKLGLILILSLAFTFILMHPAKALEKSNNIKQDDEPYRVESFTMNGAGNLDVQTSGGHITVEGSSSNTVRVEMYVRKNGRNLLPEDIDLEDWNIDISQSSSSIQAAAKRTSNRNRGWFGNNNLSISFVVYTPREMSSKLKTSGGQIETRGLEGNQKIATSGGHLELTSLKGTIEARTSGGHINLSDIQGDLEARTSGGHIDVHTSEGNIQLKTSGGHIDLAEVSGTIEAKTSGGSITADFTSIGQFADLKTSGGNVNISVPQKLGLDLNLRGSYVSTRLANFSGEVDRDEVIGKLNGGGPKISARTSGGTVSLSFKES